MKRRAFLVSTASVTALAGCNALVAPTDDKDAGGDTDPSPDTDRPQDSDAEDDSDAASDSDSDAAGDSDSDSDSDVPPQTDCGVIANQTAGPFDLDLDLVRQEISPGLAGVPLLLRLQVVEHATCTPLAGATVEVWHADQDGAYSGFAGQGTAGQDFARGEQVSDAAGMVRFETVMPGFYSGRTTHVHVRVRAAGYPNRVTQLYFPDAVVTDLQATYGPAATVNGNDGFYDDLHRMDVVSKGAGYDAVGVLGMIGAP